MHRARGASASTDFRQSPVRLVSLDGALLAFERSSGRRWLLRTNATQHLRAKAPPLVLFSITNACNLACTFCYRDVQSASSWRVDSAFDLLAGLAELGTLEVAFGGGEPFAFAGFCTLIERLTDHTPLVVHVTTNGELITREKARRLRGRVSEFRLSVYDDTGWRESLAMLQDEGFSVGLHWLVTPARLPRLREFVDELLTLGVRKLFLLSYNGDDPALHLSREQSAQLARTVNSLSELPIELGLSACWGDRMESVPQMSPDRGADCGAGGHFVSIGPDGRMSPCSFHHQRRYVKIVEDVIDGWTAMRSSGPARIRGCHRTQSLLRPQQGLWRWRAWSGNNSVDCFTVGRFASQNAADQAIAELRALTAAPQQTLLDQAWEGLNQTNLERPRGANLADTQAFTALWTAEQQAREQWLEEVATWEQGPTAVDRYATALGAGERVAALPAQVEDPWGLIAFGRNAVYLQGSTLEPFRALSWLWGYRGARVYDFGNASSNALSMVWAAKTNSPEIAREYASELGAIARGASLWGVVRLDAWEPASVGRVGAVRSVRKRLIDQLREQLEARGLRFDGRVIADRAIELSVIESEVAKLRPKAPTIVSRLWCAAYGERGEQTLASIRALNEDPSTLWEWTNQRIEGSRRWPKDLQIHRLGALLLLEARELPQSLGRGFLLRNTETPWSLEARDVRVTVALFGDQATGQLRSLGLEAKDDENRGSTTTNKPVAVLERASNLATRGDLIWNATLAAANPLTAAVEYLQSRLNLQFTAGR